MPPSTSPASPVTAAATRLAPGTPGSATTPTTSGAEITGRRRARAMARRLRSSVRLAMTCGSGRMT